MKKMYKVIGASAAITVPIAIYFWRKISSHFSEKDDEEEISECLFFTPTIKECRNRSTGKRTPCDALACNFCSYNRLISYIAETKHHLDICQYNLTVEEICILIIKLFKKGVFVRIITDKQMSEEAAGVKLLYFRKEYIPLKVVRSSMIMHNKFVIIDQKIVMTGSCNFTKQGFDGNLENIIVTNNRNVVAKFNKYFQYIWENEEKFSKF